jgi:flagellar motility protein MotE (MotC chaperone)
MNAPDYPSLRPREPVEPPLGRTPGVRLLPLLMFVAVGMLGFRIEVVVKTIAHTRNATLQVGTTTAQAEEKADDKAAAKPADAAGDKTAAAGDKAAAAGANPGDKAGEKAATPSGKGPPSDSTPDPDVDAGPIPPGTLDPKTLTKSEIETLQRLAERRDNIDKRERELAQREGLMKAGETRIDGKIAELHDLEKTIEGLLQKYDKQKQAEIDSLVKIYGAMKPKDAAAIFDSLEMPILVAVVQNMKEAKVAPIMAVMSRERAKALTEELSQRKQIGTVSE